MENKKERRSALSWGWSYEFLEFGFPKPMEVAVFIDCNGLAGAYADFRFGFAIVGEVNADAAIFGFYDDECNVVFGGHGVSNAAYFHFDFAIVDASNHGDVFFAAGVYGVGDEFFHRFAAAHYGNAFVNYFFYNVATHGAFEEF